MAPGSPPEQCGRGKCSLGPFWSALARPLFRAPSASQDELPRRGRGLALRERRSRQVWGRLPVFLCSPAPGIRWLGAWGRGKGCGFEADCGRPQPLVCETPAPPLAGLLPGRPPGLAAPTVI
ncbi:hypothetical protein P7K49_002758 [Saguinus oedipus]|uniref:Uncharacterized protein n=1 Tax=Saguinus oedipus TaxID=9490 RepID=A0ABQ9WM87_SAGOE|nr:hypothetical protein P7K49_002758 [Saguinus oedipus]